MKKFLKNIVLFLLPFVVFFVAVELIAGYSKEQLLSESNIEKSFSCIKENYNWFADIPGKNKIVLVGSSTMRYGICTDILNKLANDSEQFVNLGLNARDPLEIYFLLKNLDLKDVKAVYMGVDPWMYTKYYYTGRSYSFIVNSLYFDYNQFQLLACFWQKDKRVYQKQISALFHYYFPENRERCITNDSIPRDIGCTKWDYGQLKMNGPLNDLYQIDKFGWSDLEFSYLMKIVALCKARGIDFNAVIIPKRTDYCNYYGIQHKEILKEFVDHLLAAHFNAPTYGSFDQLNNYNTAELFEDHLHLNGNGQQLYSRIFWTMIHQPKTPFTSSYKLFQQRGS